MGAREFFGCYLLESKNPKFKGRSYIGFTVNPRRRIRQHNGEIVNGASKTQRGRPWEMVLVVYGFPSQTQALQFEWSWQHPEKSLDIRGVAARLGRKAMYGVQGKVLLLMEMLNTEPWCYFPLTIQFLSSRVSAERGRCPPPPAHVAVLVAPLEALPEVVESAEDPPDMELDEGDDEDEENGSGAGMAVQDFIGSQEPDVGPAAAAAVAAPVWAAEQSGGGASEGSELEEDLSSRLGQRLGGQLLGAQPFHHQQQQGHRGLHHQPDNFKPAPREQLEQDDLPEAAAAAQGATKKGQSGKGKGEKASAAAAARALTACMVCSKAANRTWAVCPGCGKRSHVECLARSLLEADGPGAGSLPNRGCCPSCSQPLVWMDVLSSLQNVGWVKHNSRQAAKGGSKVSAARCRSKKAATTGAAAAAAAAAVGDGLADPSDTVASPSEKKRGGRRKAVAAGAGEAAVLGAAAAVAAGTAAGGQQGGAKPRGRPRKVAPAAAALRPVLGAGAAAPAGLAFGSEELQAGGYGCGDPLLGEIGGPAAPAQDGTGVPPVAKRRGRPRKVKAEAPPASGPGFFREVAGRAADTSLQAAPLEQPPLLAGHGGAAAPQPQHPKQRRQQGATIAAAVQFQQARSYHWTAPSSLSSPSDTDHAEMEGVEAAPWDDFDSTAHVLPQHWPAGSSGSSLAAGNPRPAGSPGLGSWLLRHDSSPTAALAHEPQQQQQQQQQPPPQQAEEVVLLSDSDTEPMPSGALLGLQQRLRGHAHQAQLGQVVQQDVSVDPGYQLPVEAASPPLPQTAVTEGSPPSSSGSDPGGGTPVAWRQRQHWESPPTQRLGTFTLASPVPSPMAGTGSSPSPGSPTHPLDRSPQQQGQRYHQPQRQQQQQQAEVIELVSPSPLPLRDRLQLAGRASQQAQQGSLLQARATPSGTLPQPAACEAADTSMQHIGWAATAGPGGGTSLASGSEAAVAIGGAPVAAAAPPGAVMSRRPRAYARHLRPSQPQAALDGSAALGRQQAPALKPAKSSRALASPRGTPSPAPLRKRAQQAQQQQQQHGECPQQPDAQQQQQEPCELLAQQAGSYAQGQGGDHRQGARRKRTTQQPWFDWCVAEGPEGVGQAGSSGRSGRQGPLREGWMGHGGRQLGAAGAASSSGAWQDDGDDEVIVVSD